MHVIVALQILAYKASFDQVDELSKRSEAAIMESFYAFLDKIVVFDEEYYELQLILTSGESWESM